MTDHCDVCAVLDILALPFALSATSTPWLPLTDSYALTTCRRMPSRTTAFVVTVRSTPIVGCELTRYVADDDAGQAQHCCQLIWKDVTPRVTNGCWLAGWLAVWWVCTYVSYANANPSICVLQALCTGARSATLETKRTRLGVAIR